ncbi:MAG TPA: hypothetical protein VHX36_12115 [Candidatus Acidoferrales bacterium]|jgi:hypothetical protein|nr:hypothetical protein [Candidatus Acidoferrales bacterium]
MLENSAVRAKLRALICLLAVSIFALACFAPRAAAQAADGPQSGAAPSDAPSSSQPGSHSVPQIGGHPSLAGSWTLNKNQSDDPREKMRDAMGGGGGGGRSGGGGGRGGMGAGRRGGGQGGMLADFSQLTIAQTPTSAKVTGSSGHVLAICSSDTSSPSAGAGDNSSASSDANSNGNSQGGRFESAPAPAQWQGTQLVATTQGRRGGSTTRTYELSPDGTQLYVTTKMDNPRFQEPVTFRLVYDAANSKSGSSE